MPRPRPAFFSVQSALAFVRERQGTSSFEISILLALIVSAVFLGVEILDRSLRKTDQVAGLVNTLHSRAITSDANDAAWLPQSEADPRILQLQLFAAGGFVLVAAGFVTRSSWRRVNDAKMNKIREQALNRELSARHAAIFEKRQQILVQLSNTSTKEVGNQLTVERLMSPRIARVHTRSSVEQVRALMKERFVRHVLVCDDVEDRLLGVVSDRDLDRNASARTAEELMTPYPTCVTPETAILPAVTLLFDRRISCLPVVVDGKPVGVLTTTDLMMALQCLLQHQQRETEPAVASA